MGFGMFFTALLASNRFAISGGGISDFHFLMQDYPAAFAVTAVLALACWLAYFTLRRRLRTSP